MVDTRITMLRKTPSERLYKNSIRTLIFDEIDQRFRVFINVSELVENMGRPYFLFLVGTSWPTVVSSEFYTV